MRGAGTCVVAIALMVGCGGGDGDDGDGDDDGPTEDAVLESCAILGTCTGEPISSCVDRFGPLFTTGQLACIRAATVTDCLAVFACIGVEITTDPACVDGCDGNTFVRCDGAQRAAYDCATYLESTGSTCVVGATRSSCGTRPCTVDGEEFCTGATVHAVCDSGIQEDFDCARLGLECVLGPGCHGPVIGTCTAGTPATCDGDGLVECIGTELRRIDCPALHPNSTCVVDGASARCGYGTACIDGMDSCAGNVLETCVLGGQFSIDCTTIGGSTCFATPPTAECTP